MGTAGALCVGPVGNALTAMRLSLRSKHTSSGSKPDMRSDRRDADVATEKERTA